MKLFFDGGCRPAPFGMETAVVVSGRAYLQRNLGAGSGMEAEWLALLHALRLADELALVDPVLLGDAAAVIAQANGTAKCRGASVPHFETFAALTVTGRPRIRWIKRSQNLAGIALARARR